MSTKSIRITSFFMGSTHKAKYRNGKGQPYKNDKNIYLYKKDDRKLQFTFSGPNLFDNGKELTIKSIHKKGTETLEEVIGDYLDKGYEVNIEVKGHSRGATIAGKVWDSLKQIFKEKTENYLKETLSEKLKENLKKSPEDTKEEIEELLRGLPKVRFVLLGKFDEYSGPINRLNKENDIHELDDQDNSVVVYSLRSRRPFNSPAIIKNASVYIFTINSHEASYIVGGAAMRRRKKGQLKNGLYLHVERVPKFDKKTTKKQQESLKKFKNETKFIPIDDSNASSVTEKYLKKLFMTSRRGSLLVDALNERFKLNLRLNSIGKIKGKRHDSV